MQTQLVHRNDAGVLELAANLGFFDKALQHVGVALQVISEDLHGHVSSQVRVPSLVDHADTAGGNLADDLVARRSDELSSCRAPMLAE